MGGYFKLRQELPATALAGVEGTAAVYQLAIRYARPGLPLFEKLFTREAMWLGLPCITPSWTPMSRVPDAGHGGICQLTETKVRIDQVHHALSAMDYIGERCTGYPNLPASVKK